MFRCGHRSGTGHGGVLIPWAQTNLVTPTRPHPCRWRTRAWSVVGYRLPCATAKTKHNQVAVCAPWAITWHDQVPEYVAALCVYTDRDQVANFSLVIKVGCLIGLLQNTKHATMAKPRPKTWTCLYEVHTIKKSQLSIYAYHDNGGLSCAMVKA